MSVFNVSILLRTVIQVVYKDGSCVDYVAFVVLYGWTDEKFCEVNMLFDYSASLAIWRQCRHLKFTSSDFETSSGKY